jgi:hypothetical protein
MNLKRGTDEILVLCFPCNRGSVFRTRALSTLSRSAFLHPLSFDCGISCSMFASPLPIFRQARSYNECVFVQLAPASLQDHVKELLSKSRLKNVQTQRIRLQPTLHSPFRCLCMLPLSMFSDSNRACKENLVAPGIVKEPNLWIDAF